MSGQIKKPTKVWLSGKSEKIPQSVRKIPASYKYFPTAKEKLLNAFYELFYVAATTYLGLIRNHLRTCRDELCAWGYITS
jgi:hypothetical protein